MREAELFELPGVTHDRQDRRITIHGDQLAADYLLCIDRECKLIQEWVGR